MTSATTLPVIEYARGDVPFRRRHRWIMLVASLPSVIVPFAPFVYDVSPLSAAQHMFDGSEFDAIALSLLGLAFFAALPAFAWRAMLVRRLAMGRRARGAILLIAVPFWIAMLWVNLLWCRSMIEDVRNDLDLPLALSNVWPFALTIPLACLALLIAWRLHRKGDTNRAILIVLTIPFLATATSCLLGFRNDDWQFGYWLSMYVAVLWLAELAADGLKLVWRMRKAEE
jgi:hypothetical protein